MLHKTEIATFGGGCFWCTEAIFKRIEGVLSVVSGYAGGNKKNPSYDQVSTGLTNHAEAIQLTFDPMSISYNDLLEVFFATHNPTTMNKQGNDTGTQYRSVIFYHSKQQEQQAKEKIAALENKHIYEAPIVTQVVPFDTFYTAEDYHQNYYEKNTDYPYCEYVISPKIKKLLERFADKVKKEYKQKT